MRVYQSSDGTWIFWDGEAKHFYDTQLEAMDAMSKIKFAEQVRRLATQQAQLVDEIINLKSVYFDRGNQSGGSDPITDEDVAAAGVTAAQIGNFITFAEQAEKWINGEFEAPADGSLAAVDHDIILNQLREDV
jgi:hypothetical protein